MVRYPRFPRNWRQSSVLRRRGEPPGSWLGDPTDAVGRGWLSASKVIASLAIYAWRHIHAPKHPQATPPRHPHRGRRLHRPPPRHPPPLDSRRKITGYRQGDKLLLVDLAELDTLTRPVTLADHGA